MLPVDQPSRRAAGSLELYELARAEPAGELDLEPVAASLEALAVGRLEAGSRVGVAVGSRGIARIGEVVAAVVSAVGAAGARPVIIPAMGSHGDATPEGQLALLGQLGVDAGALGAGADASMEVERIGSVAGGHDVLLARAALSCDAVVPVNRVKPHTSFRAPIESGLVKMLTIGLGKQAGASSLHRAGFAAFGEVLPAAAELVLSRLAVPFGVALIEDPGHRLARVEPVPGERLAEREAELLAEAWERLALLPFPEVDVLLLKEMGKTISGAGMDPNVTGRFSGDVLPARTRVGRLAVLDLTDGSHGNAVGVGVADLVTERLRAKIDWAPTYTNALTSRQLSGAKLPLVAGSDLDALALALASLTGRDGVLRVVVAASTLELGRLAVSAPLVGAAEAAGYVRRGGPCRPEFAEDGRLLRIGGIGFFPETPPAAPPAS